MRRCARGYVFVLAAAVIIAVHAAGGESADEYRVPLMVKAPVIDGKLEKGEWDAACGFDGLVWEGKIEERAARAWIGATETDIYAAIESELPPDGKLLAKIDRDAVKIVHDDAMEVFVDPLPGQARGVEYQVLASAAGKRAYLAEARGGEPENAAWDGGYQIAHGFTADRWVTEVRVPLEKIAPGRKATDGAWSISVCRDWKQPWKFSSTAPRFRSKGTVFTFVKDGALAAQHRNLSDPFTKHVQAQCSLFNPTAAPVTVKARIELKPNKMPEVVREESMTVAPGETKLFEFKHRDDISSGFELKLGVTSADGKTLYSRAYGWGKARERRWETTPVVLKPLDFKFSYYPYQKKLRVLVDGSGLPAGASLESAAFVLRKKNDAQAAGTWTVSEMKSARQEAIFETPELDGLYEIVMTGKGTNVPTEPVVKTLERKRFDWERKGLGTSDKVFPPFTPIEVKGKTLRTVLREHTLNDAGLVDQVTAGQPGHEKPLLAAPARFVVRMDGAEAAVRAEPLAFRETAGHRVVTECALSAGALKMKAMATWEYDGALKYDLTLQPTDGKSIEALTLEIPLLAAAPPPGPLPQGAGKGATMIHAMGDLLRNTVYDYLPAGEGVIWDARKASCSDLPANFCSYIFLGNPQRGLSWFAENDRGWSWDRKTPNVEVVRQGKQVLLRVHLINKPLVIAAPRQLSFGLLAGPVKPRLEGWRHRWWTDKYSMLGTCINWLGGPGSCGNLYPPNKDPYYWQIISRGNTERVPRPEMDECVKKGLDVFKTLDYIAYGAESREEATQSWKNHVYHNVGGSRYQATMVFYYNRATYNACEEYPTFMDEWVTDDYNAHEFKRDAGEVKIVPSPSYIDHALHWYAESFQLGRNRGVYWDNWFFQPSYSRVMSDAYMDEDGKVIPATGVWAMRDLAKRTFVMMSELNMKPITMPHMTSTNPLPAHSFATVQYDWEWKYSQGDVQTRFTRAYILMCSNGELAGMWPVMLGDHGAQANDEWTQRTFAGVTLVHELIAAGAGKVWKTLRDPLIPLMQNPKLKAYRYWDEDPQPVAADKRDLPLILYSVPGETAAAVLCSYAEQDEDAVLSINAQALGFAGGCKVSNLETGEALVMDDGRVKLKVKKHEVLGLRIEPK